MRDLSQIREQLEESLRKYNGLKKTMGPQKGWIRSIREALGMSGRQLADRIEVEQSRIPEMEKTEIHGNITLKSLRRAAEAMNCEMVYAFIPKTSLDASVRIQAEKTAKQKLTTVAHTMRLEEQGLTAKNDAKHLAKMVDQWVENPPRWLWDTK